MTTVLREGLATCFAAIDYLTVQSGYIMYHQARHSQILRSAHTVYLCVLCGSQNKQRLFPYTALTGWFTARYGLGIYI